MVVLAFLTDPDVVRKILAPLGLPTTAPALVPARTPHKGKSRCVAGSGPPGIPDPA